MKPTKYLILLNDKGEEIPVMFDSRLSHKDVATKMSMKVVSAGAFIVISGYATGGGGSMTLNIMESRPQDMDIIRKLIGAK